MSSVSEIEDAQKRLDSVRREVRNLTVMSLRPDLGPDQAALVKNLERSARAEMNLRVKALDYAQSKAKNEEAGYK